MNTKPTAAGTLLSPPPCSEIVCCCHGWERESWDIGPLSSGEYAAGTTNRVYAKERIFWWYGIDLSRHTMLVADGDPEPKFIIPENLPFRVLKCSIKELTTLSFPNAPDQARRANDVRLPTGTHSRRCLQPAGSVNYLYTVS
jgi:hypothetical protein